MFRLNRLNFIRVVKSIKKAIAIKQSTLFGKYNNFSVMQPVTSQCWWSLINLDKILVFLSQILLLSFGIFYSKHSDNTQ